MKCRKKLITDFDEDLWGGLLKDILIECDGTATVRFKQGMEMSWKDKPETLLDAIKSMIE